MNEWMRRIIKDLHKKLWIVVLQWPAVLLLIEVWCLEHKSISLLGFRYFCWVDIIYLASSDQTITCSASYMKFLNNAEQGLLRVPFTRTSIMQNSSFSVVDLSVVDLLIWNGLLLTLHSLPITFSRYSSLNFKWFYLAVLGLGALLSSSLE